MDKLRRQVRRAQWWLGVQRFVGGLGWCWAISLAIAAGLIALDRFYPMGVEEWVWGVGALVVGLAAAIAWSILTGHGSLDAAIEIDRRFHLKERVSSTLALSDEELETESGQALVADAVRRVERINLTEHFRVSPDRRLLYPLVSALAAALVVLFVHPAQTPAVVANTAGNSQQVKKTTKQLQGKLVEQRRKAEQQGLEDAKELFRQLERDIEGLTNQTKSERKEALVKLNDLSRQVAERRGQLAGADALRKQLKELDDLSKGPADRMLEDIAKGNFDKALEELKKLKSDLASGKLTPEQQKQLARQLDELKKKLEDLARAQKDAEKELENRVEKARQAGREDEANQLQQRLNELRQQGRQMNQLENLAQKLGQCAQCLNDGNMKDAGDMLDQLQADMEGLQQQLQELNMLDDAMEQLGNAKQQMNCQACGGEGCPLCQGGMGMGEGQGSGLRPEAEDDAKFYDANTPQKINPGNASIVGDASGPNVPGDVRQQIQQQYESSQSESADPLATQPMPRKHRQHALEYFDRFREGK